MGKNNSKEVTEKQIEYMRYGSFISSIIMLLLALIVYVVFSDIVMFLIIAMIGLLEYPIINYIIIPNLNK